MPHVDPDPRCTDSRLAAADPALEGAFDHVPQRSSASTPCAANDPLRPGVRRAAPRPPRSRLRAGDESTPTGAAAALAGLDDVDRRLLRILQVDGRITNLKLAALVGLSSASTHERVRRLVRDGTISGFSARLNPRLLRAGLLVFAEVRLTDMSNTINAAFKAAVKLCPEILECHEVAGGFDFLLKTRVAHMDAYRDLVAAVAWRLPGVRDVRTYAVMEELKNLTAIPV
jgi:Lrp/AsnC family leucine-responsive transcriptional regulator